MNGRQLFKYYFVEDGEKLENALEVKAWDADEAAEKAVEYDWAFRDGWERGETEFRLTVISPEGKETTYIGMHEQTIAHRVEREKS